MNEINQQHITYFIKAIIFKTLQQAKQIGVGPQQNGFPKERQRTKQVGVGPQQNGFPKERQRTKQVGVGPQQREFR
ncbi:hypothetical protein [Staphylococcus lugdunensis]|uniref:hypothetical protein n=1 Tax=Staphylococcus lugdunensis TaxID=28035 RepID=UPI0001C54199|nr:hypothetical protein [Staphylococcus lugdunensis]ADC86788.1 hypothetical protein SLGD_00640 [Staphylococcus lugdunensis HKU09-01]MCH8640553.1 hypothetical protein [Staphylococcus lugdunensis]MCH8677633.1 hypothetical protein [Staphylococcus lugdunensis]MCI2764537.1 hypothetical protein [Staphylococcus lugdunensis]MCI2793927.1 hypothetical protein [Staphylococcus lugdunensis]